MSRVIHRWKSAAVVVGMVLLASPAAMAATVSGILADAGTGEPLPEFCGSYLSIEHGTHYKDQGLFNRSAKRFCTDASGAFTIEVPTFSFLRIGATALEPNPKYERRNAQESFWRGGVAGDIAGLVLPVTLFPLPLPAGEAEAERSVEARTRLRKHLPKSTISGVVLDRATGQRVPNMTVIQYRSYKNGRLTTDADGRFSLPGMLPGTYFFQQEHTPA
jgi:hypothetical protein